MDNLDMQPEDLAGYGNDGGYYPSPEIIDFDCMWKGMGYLETQSYRPVKILSQEGETFTATFQDGITYKFCVVDWKSDSDEYRLIRRPKVSEIDAPYFVESILENKRLYDFSLSSYNKSYIEGRLSKQQRLLIQLELTNKIEELETTLGNTLYKEQEKISNLKRKIGKLKKWTDQ